MGNRRRQAHVYDPAEIDSLKGVPLPEKIRCGRCHKHKTQTHYSEKQRTDARWAIRNGGQNARYNINCMPCTGNQVVEIECVMCRKTKGIDDFAKGQRKKLDTAKCYTCIEDQLDQRGINEGAYDNDNPFFPPESSAGRFPDMHASSTTAASDTNSEWSKEKEVDDGEDGGFHFLTSSTQHLSLASSDYGTLIDTDDVWTTVQRTKSWHTGSANPPSTSSKFDPNKYGKPSTPSASGSTTGSVHTFNSSVAERSDEVSYKNGWAKIKAYDPKDTTNMPKTKPEPDAWSDEEENEDEEEDSDDDTVI